MAKHKYKRSKDPYAPGNMNQVRNRLRLRAEIEARQGNIPRVSRWQAFGNPGAGQGHGNVPGVDMGGGGPAPSQHAAPGPSWFNQQQHQQPANAPGSQSQLRGPPLSHGQGNHQAWNPEFGGVQPPAGGHPSRQSHRSAAPHGPGDPLAGWGEQNWAAPRHNGSVRASQLAPETDYGSAGPSRITPARRTDESEMRAHMGRGGQTLRGDRVRGSHGHNERQEQSRR